MLIYKIFNDNNTIQSNIIWTIIRRKNKELETTNKKRCIIAPCVGVFDSIAFKIGLCHKMIDTVECRYNAAQNSKILH